MKKKKTITFLCLFLVFISLVSCGEKTLPNEKSEYHKEVLVEHENSIINGMVISGSCLYYYGYIQNEPASSLYIINLDTGDEITAELPDNQNVSCLASSQGGEAWLIAKESHSDDGENFTFTRILKKYDSSGSTTEAEDIIEISENVLFLDFKYADSLLYILYQDQESLNLEVYNTLTKERSVSDIDKNVSGLIKINADIYGLVDDDGDLSLSLLNYEKSGTEEEDIPLTLEPNSKVFSIGDEKIFFCSNNCFYSSDIVSGDENTQLINFTSSSVDTSEILFFGCYGESYYFVVDNPLARHTEIICMAPGATERTTLKLAMLNSSRTIYEAVSDFNETNDSYYIEIRDYTQEKGSEEAALLALGVDIVSGSPPDLYYLEGLNIEQYEMQGLFLDISTYIEADPELRDCEFVGLIFPLLEKSGALYQIISGFSVSTIIGTKSELSEYKNGWSFAELLNFIEKNDASDSYIFGASTTREAMLKSLCSYNMQSFIDWESGVCNFDNDLFKELLNFCSKLPSEKDVPYAIQDTPYLISDKAQRLMVLDDFNYFLMVQLYSAMLQDELCYIGFPNDFGNGSAIKPEYGLAISSQTEHKDAAWQFARILLTDEFQNEIYGDGNNGFPTNKRSFDNLMQTLASPPYYYDEDGNFHGMQAYASWGNYEVLLNAATAGEIEDFEDLINSIECLYLDCPDIYSILIESAQPYFYGDKTAEQVIDIIQNRVSLYLAERK